MKKTLMLWLVLWFSVCAAQAQRTRVEGIVKDSLTGEGLPYAAVIWENSNVKTATDINGRFSLSVPNRKGTLLISYMGYHTREINLSPQGRRISLDIPMADADIALDEVTVKPKRERYRRRDNPAVEFVRRVIESRDANDPKAHDFYSYDHYEKILFAKNDYTFKPKADGKKGRFDFLQEFVDTLDAGTTILPVSEKEKMETVYFRKSPQSEKRVVKGYKSSGIDEIFSSDGVHQFLGEVFREVNIFQNNIPLFLQRFVSPLSTIGPSYYKYYLLDTLTVGGRRCADLSFVPFNSETFGFTGHLYVTLDSTYFVQKAVLSVPRKINLNFVSRMAIEQEFTRTADGTRLPVKDDIQVNFKLTENSKGLYARRLNVYTRHSFEEPATKEAQVFRQAPASVTLDDAYRQTEDFWEEHRPAEAVRRNPNSMEKLMERLNSVRAYRWGKEIFSSIVAGYVPTHRNRELSKFDFGPVNSIVNHNTLEGMRFRVGGATTTALSRRWSFDGYMAYGVKDRKVKYDALAEYSFNDRKEFRKEFPVHSLRFEYMYDINKLGQNYMYTSKDNMMLMIRRKKDRNISYLRQAELTYTREHYNGLSYNAIVRNRREYATPYAVFERFAPDGAARPIGHYDMTQLEVGIRYAYKEKFYQTRNLRVPITFDAWIVNANHVMAKKDFLGSDYDYQRTEVGLQKRFWFSAFGYLDVIAKAGKVWSKVPYPLLLLPNANLTYTIQKESYTNMNALEFINDEYASWDITYYMNGNLLNRLPLIRKLKWREVFCFRGLWGHLTDKNNPMKHPSEGLFRFPADTRTMERTPYMEASVGIENIFKFLRIDYVWRMTYRDNPGIQRRGVRMTMSLSF